MEFIMVIDPFDAQDLQLLPYAVDLGVVEKINIKEKNYCVNMSSTKDELLRLKKKNSKTTYLLSFIPKHKYIEKLILIQFYVQKTCKSTPKVHI